MRRRSTPIASSSRRRPIRPCCARSSRERWCWRAATARRARRTPRPCRDRPAPSGGAGIARERFCRKTRLARWERAERDLHREAGKGWGGSRLHVGVFDQSAPVAVSPRNIVGAGQLGGPRGIAAGKRNHFATRIGTERGQLHGAPVIAPDYPQSDHGSKLRGAGICNVRHGFELIRHAAQGRFGAGQGDFHDCGAFAVNVIS